MAEQVKEDNQKTIVSFVVGLLIGGLLVWAFSGDAGHDDAVKVKKDDMKEQTTDDKKTETTKTDDTTATTPAALPVGDGKVTVGDVGAGSRVSLADTTFPVKEGWVGVRDYADGRLGNILGVARFSEAQGLIPKEIILQRATVTGKEYAIVFYTENGDLKFNLAEDKQIDKEFATFTAK